VPHPSRYEGVVWVTGWQRLLLWAMARLPAGDGFVLLDRGLRGHLGDTAFSAWEMPTSRPACLVTAA
jgi:hypothetical protein